MWSPFVRSSGDNRTYRIPYVATVPERNLLVPVLYEYSYGLSVICAR